jgi:hypothetical protein
MLCIQFAHNQTLLSILVGVLAPDRQISYIGLQTFKALLPNNITLDHTA